MKAALACIIALLLAPLAVPPGSRGAGTPSLTLCGPVGSRRTLDAIGELPAALAGMADDGDLRVVVAGRHELREAMHLGVRATQRLILEGMLVSYQAVIDARLNQDVPEQIVPGAMAHFDLPDVAAALAPRRIDLTNPVNPLGQRMSQAEAERAYAQVANVRVSVRDGEDEPFSTFLPALLSAL